MHISVSEAYKNRHISLSGLINTCILRCANVYIYMYVCVLEVYKMDAYPFCGYKRLEVNKPFGSICLKKEGIQN